MTGTKPTTHQKPPVTSLYQIAAPLNSWGLNVNAAQLRFHQINAIWRITDSCCPLLTLQALIDMSAMPGVHELCEMLDTKSIPRWDCLSKEMVTHFTLWCQAGNDVYTSPQGCEFVTVKEMFGRLRWKVNSSMQQTLLSWTSLVFFPLEKWVVCSVPLLPLLPVFCDVREQMSTHQGRSKWFWTAMNDVWAVW